MREHRILRSSGVHIFNRSHRWLRTNPSKTKNGTIQNRETFRKSGDIIPHLNQFQKN